MDAALVFFQKLTDDGVLDVAAFEQAAGVGVEVPLEDIAAAVAKEIEAHRDTLLEERYTGEVYVFFERCFLSLGLLWGGWGGEEDAGGGSVLGYEGAHTL